MPTIRIIYKSGTTLDVKCKECVVNKRGPMLNELIILEGDPKPLLMGVDDISAVWVIRQ